MVQRENVGGAWQVRLPIRGTGRWVAAALLSVWLCAWAGGEVFVLGTLAAGFRDLVAPGWHLDWLPAMKQTANVAPRFALLFMGLWVTLWTIGGALGMRELARMLFGEDIVRWDANGIDAVHRGVRQFAAGTTEARAVTRLLSEPLALAPLATHGRLLFFDEPDASLSAPALHALTHALREVLPCLFDNADDLGVTWTVSPRPAIALFDAHPDGLGAAADLGDDDLESLLGAAAELLRCTCAASCAACCESTSCTDESVPLDRHGASRALEALLVPRPIRIPSSIQAADPAAARLRRTG